MIKIDDSEKQIKIDEDIFKLPPEQWNLKTKDEEKNFAEKLKEQSPALVSAALILAIVVAVAVGFLWARVNGLKTDMKNLGAKVSAIDTTTLASRQVITEAKLENLLKENEKLRSDLAQLRGEIEALKSRKEKAAAVSQKPQPPKKKAIGKTPGMR